MRAFRDANGKEWVLRIDAHHAKRVKTLLGVGLFGLVAKGWEGAAELLGDPVAFVDVLYLLCKDEADGRKMSDEDFGRAMDGSALAAAADAFVEELIDFFPPAKRPLLRKQAALARGLEETAVARVMAAMEQMTPDSILKGLSERSSGGSGSAPGSSEGSTPDPSLSGS
jgi:hypothetical protein